MNSCLKLGKSLG